MSKVIPLVPAAVEYGLVPVYVGPGVRAIDFLNALASAGLTYRHDIKNKRVIIEPQKEDGPANDAMEQRP